MIEIEEHKNSQERYSCNKVMNLMESSSSHNSVITSQEQSPQRFTRHNKMPASRFKGVVPQPNGKWGAQIYEKHERVWLGTFNTQEAAAKSYDRAAIKFRGSEAVTNLAAAVTETDPEIIFLAKHSKHKIIDMLRKHTYDEELLHNPNSIIIKRSPAGETRIDGDSTAKTELPVVLFEKILTTSDVGKLHRLVIPKKYAERCFSLDTRENPNGVLLSFEDVMGKTWRFRFSYWSSSHSYVFTKGWSRFVKEKGILRGDVVIFSKGKKSDKLFVSIRPMVLLPSPKRRGLTHLLDTPSKRARVEDPVECYAKAMYNNIRMTCPFPCSLRNLDEPLVAEKDRGLYNPGFKGACVSKLRLFGTDFERPTLNLFPC